MPQSLLRVLALEIMGDTMIDNVGGMRSHTSIEGSPAYNVSWTAKFYDQGFTDNSQERNSCSSCDFIDGSPLLTSTTRLRHPM